MLSEDEKSLVRAYFSGGPAALLDADYTMESVQAFLARDDVRVALQLLETEFRYQDPLAERGRFLTRRNLSKLGGHAVAVLAQGLAGPVYARDTKGNVVIGRNGRPMINAPEPTKGQLRSAEVILERTGIEGDLAKVNLGADTNLQQVFLRPQPKAENMPKLVLDPSLKTEKEKAISREIIRNAITRLTPRIIEAKVKVDEVLHPKIKRRIRPPKAKKTEPVDTVSKD